MEIQVWLFLTFWAVASTIFLGLAFHLLDNTKLSKSVSPVVMSLFKHSFAISSCLSSSYALMFRALPRYDSRSWYLLLVNGIASLFFGRTIDGIIMWKIFTAILLKLKTFLIKIWIIFAPFLATSIQIFSIVYICGFCLLLLYVLSKNTGMLISCFCLVLCHLIFALMGVPVRTRREIMMEYYSSTLSSSAVFSSFAVSVVWWVCVCIISVLVLCVCIIFLTELRGRVAILIVLHSYLFFISGENTNFFPILVLFISHFISSLWVKYSISKYREDRRFQKLVRVASKVKQVYTRFEEKGGLFKTLIEMAVGLLLAILFQQFFKVTSFDEALAFVCFAAMWVANLTLLGVGGDMGVFYFLLSNMVVGSMQNEFGLRRNTWLTYGFAVFLTGMRLALQYVTIRYGIGQHIQIPFNCCCSTSFEDEDSDSTLEDEVEVEDEDDQV